MKTETLITNIIMSFFLFSCTADYGQLKIIANTPDLLEENSGIQIINDPNSLWMVADSGNDDHIYAVNTNGNITRDINIKHAKNKDWEEITKDEEGNIFIGDFGNNDNERKDLKIYKIPNPETHKGDELEAIEINFYYPEQKKFPPKKKERFYDAEAFFYLNNNLYIFTKNRAHKFDGTTLLYKIPAKKGNHKAELISSYKTCEQPRKCAITGADISPNKKKVALLGHDKVWILKDFSDDNFFNGTIEVLSLGHDSQKEGITFINENALYITDEKTKSIGGNIYRLDLK
ncbi:hypothetical protein [Joostella atrarenae]|uniref:hypothetical protein n=1 Tax=Joostella atrarenae TaxID=679257 RepID=UPI001F314221|nr:hypothetical protein [Joostella atrarenae]